MIAYAFGSDWIWVLLVVVVLFGGSQLPKLAKNAGDAMKEFRKAHDEAADGAQPAAAPSQASAIVPPAIASAPVVAQPVVAQPVVGQPAATVPSASQVVVPQAVPVASGPAATGANADQVTLSRAELDALITVAKERAQETQQPQA